MLEKDTIAGLSVEELLEANVAEIAEVQPFQPKPTGVYGFNVKKCELGEVGESYAIKVEYEITEVIELVDETQAEAVGELPAKYTESYFIGGDSDYGLKTFRTIFGGLVDEGEEVTIRELMERCVGAQGSGLLKFRKYKHKDTGEMREVNNWEATAIDLA